MPKFNSFIVILLLIVLVVSLGAAAVGLFSKGKRDKAEMARIKQHQAYQNDSLRVLRAYRDSTRLELRSMAARVINNQKPTIVSAPIKEYITRVEGRVLRETRVVYNPVSASGDVTTLNPRTTNPVRWMIADTLANTAVDVEVTLLDTDVYRIAYTMRVDPLSNEITTTTIERPLEPGSDIMITEVVVDAPGVIESIETTGPASAENRPTAELPIAVNRNAIRDLTLRVLTEVQSVEPFVLAGVEADYRMRGPIFTRLGVFYDPVEQRPIARVGLSLKLW